VNDTTTFTTYGDLNAPCVVHDNTIATTSGGGAVTLLGTLDDFNAPADNTARWLSGSWSGSAYTPVQANGRLTLPGGGFVRSVATQRLGEMEVVAEIGSGAWQHIGFAPNGFGANQYLIFSTYTGGGNLYARTNNNTSEQRVNLGPIPTGQHRYRIAWNSRNSTTDEAVFSIDGIVVATLTAPATNANNYAVYLSNNGATALNVDTLHAAPPYAAGGNYTSCILDAPSGGWGSVAWSAALPTGTALTLQTRTSADAATWSAWETIAVSGNSVVQQGRYLQYRVSFSTTNTGVSPRLDSVTISPAGAQMNAAEADALHAALPERWGESSEFLPLVNQ